MTTSRPTALPGTRTHPTGSTPVAAHGRPTSPRGASGVSPRATCTSCRTRRASTRSSWDAGRATSPRGSPDGAVVASDSTTPRTNSPPRGCFSESSISPSPSSTAMLNEPRSPTAASTSRSPSTAQRSGATRTDGSPEAARLLRPGGQLVFLGHSNLVMLCMRESETEAAAAELLRDLFGMHRFEWPDEGEVEFAIPHGEMVRLLRGSGFEIEDWSSSRRPREHPLRTGGSRTIGPAVGRAKRSGRPGRFDEPRLPIRGASPPGTTSPIRVPTVPPWSTRNGSRGSCRRGTALPVSPFVKNVHSGRIMTSGSSCAVRMSVSTPGPVSATSGATCAPATRRRYTGSSPDAREPLP